MAAFREKIQSCRGMVDKIPGLDSNAEKQKKELEFYQQKYKEKWYTTSYKFIQYCNVILLALEVKYYKLSINEQYLICALYYFSELLERFKTLPLFTADVLSTLGE